MGHRFPEQKPSFFWQGVLIVLPVVVLAAVGLISLRQDKVLAELEARRRAQTIADDLADQIWSQLTTQTNREEIPSFEVDRAGQLTFPPPLPLAPTPQPFDLATLNNEQAALWQAAQRDSLEKPVGVSAIESWEKFIQNNPPESFAALAHFSMALLLAQQGRTVPALDQLDQVIKKFPEAKSESGLPLLPMALRKQLELTPSQTNSSPQSLEPQLTTYGSNLVFHPTPLTPLLLDQMPALEANLGLSGHTQRWRDEWRKHEQARGLYDAARAEFQKNVSRGVAYSQVVSVQHGANRAGSALISLTAPVPFANSDLRRVFWFTEKKSNYIESSTNSSSSESPDQTWLAVLRGEEANYFQILCLPARILDIARSSQSAYFQRRAAREQSNAANRRGVRARKVTAKNSLRSVTVNLDVLNPQRDLTSVLAKTFATTEERLPDYFDISLDIAGRAIISSNSLEAVTYQGGGKGGGQYWAKTRTGVPPAILASASKSEGGTEFLRVAVHLIGPEILYATQRARTVWFGMLIGVSAAAALIGFLAAWRAFQKQQRLSEMKSNFVSSVSHELRAPIASVRLMAEGLERGKIQEPQKQNEYYRFIVQECRRLSSLIENVLDFSRIEQGRKQYEFEPTDLVALVQQTVKLMEPYAAEKGVRLETSNIQHSTSTIELEVDGRAIQQALVNLIDNAIKHSPDGATVTVGLDLTNQSGAGAAPAAVDGPIPLLTRSAGSLSPIGGEGQGEGARFMVGPGRTPVPLSLWVEDHGNGIPPEEHERIFERFYRRGSELRRETQGVGIGLSIVMHIVEAHGGRVRVRSAVGKGSRFTIELLGINSQAAMAQR